MTSRHPFALLALLALLGLGSCVEPYAPKLAPGTADLLVVTGFINSQGISTFQLSRSLSPTDTKTPPAETRALVSIRSEAGATLPLSEGPAGTYTSGRLTLNPSLRYKLHVTTTAGREYESDFSAVKVAPPIDQVRYRYEEEAAGVRILADAHDDARASTYYRWQYEQTWQFTSQYQAVLQYNPTTKLVEPRLDDIYHCWHTESSTTIQQATTTGLARDAVLDYPLVLLAVNGEQLRTKYSILVRLFTQTQEEYDYWEALRKNSQSVGSLNDPLPSQVSGNVHCLSDASEVVLGYVGVHATSEQRIFIRNLDVPQVAQVRPDTLINRACKVIVDERCPPREPCLPPGVTGVFDTPYLVIFDYQRIPGRGYLNSPYYYGSTPECVDCRLRGTNVKPSFWQ